MKVDRIKIYGSTCSGKTSLAIQLSEILKIPVYHLDDIFWEENWQEKQPEEFREEVESIVNSERWIIDGNYSRVKEITLPRTTLAIILNPSLFVVYWRLIIRSLARRGKIRKEVTRLPEKIGEEDRMFSALNTIFELGYHAFKFKFLRMRNITAECINILGSENVLIFKRNKHISRFLQNVSTL